MAASTVEFRKALNSLERSIELAAIEVDPDRFELARDASIQRFEFCIELAWKVSSKKLGSSSLTAKPVLREMADQGLIDRIEMWFDFIDARNKSSHTYKEEIAVEVFNSAKKFLPYGLALCSKLESS